jgi:uncharacterized protein YbcI
MVAIYKEYMGRGPEHAVTTLAGDTVLTVCRGGLTKAELSLVENGEAETVREIRRKFQTAMADDIKALVERVTGRQPLTLLSDHDVTQDLAVEVVMLDGA